MAMSFRGKPARSKKTALTFDSHFYPLFLTAVYFPLRKAALISLTLLAPAGTGKARRQSALSLISCVIYAASVLACAQYLNSSDPST
jgi:hypothetical protein